MFLSLIAEITVFKRKQRYVHKYAISKNVSDKAGSQNGCGVDRY